MARIIDSLTGSRRTVQLSADDVISIVREYQQLTHILRDIEDIRDLLQNRVISIPEG